MGRWLVAMLLLAGVAQVSADFTLGTFDYMVDPGRIFSWKQQWMASQIQLSKSNQGATGVDVTFFVSFSSGIANGVFEVTFPAGFDLRSVARSGISVSGQVVQMTQSFPASTDLQITVPGVINPATPGPYGPFALRSRLAPNGQTLDANLAFGSIYINPTEGTISGLTVAYATGANTVINSASNTLLFTFSLAKSLWAHDVFKLTLASQFTLAATPICRVNDIPSKVNNYNGTLSDIHQLSCAVTAKTAGSPQVLWIYGLKSNVDFYLHADNKAVQLSVSGFTNPDQDYPENAYSWTVETLRFNSHNVLESGTTTGPATDPGKITSITWVPTWGRATSAILRGQTLYMDMTITFTDALNAAGGSVSLTTTGTLGSWGGTTCYVVSSVPVTSGCSVTGQITTISGLGVVPTGGTLVIRHLVTFGEAASVQAVSSITTKSAAGNTVDTGVSLASFTLPGLTAGNPLTLDVLLQQKDGTTVTKAGESQYVKFGLKGTNGLIVATSTTSSLTVSCPFASTSTGLDDFQFVPKAGWAGEYKSNVAGDYEVNFNSVTGSIAFSDLTFVAGSMKVETSGATTYKPGTITFKATTQMADAAQLVLGFSTLSLPLIVDNPATAYECAVDLSASSGKPASGIARFIITSQDFKNTGFTYFCSSGNINGAPVRVSFLPKGVSLFADSGAKTYYVEIGMPTSVYGSTFYGSGVTDGGVYPMDSNQSGNISMIVKAGSGSIVHRVKGLGLITTTSTVVEIYFPVGKALTTPTDSISLRSFFTLSTDSRLNYVTHDGSAAMYGYDNTGDADGSAFFEASSPEASNTIQNGDRLTTNPTINFILTATQSMTADTFFYVVLPKGYSFSSYKDVLAKVGANAQVSFPWKKYFSSPNLAFAFPGILVKEALSGAQISGQESTVVSLRGLNLPVGSGIGSTTIVLGALNGILNSRCFNRYIGTIPLSKGKVQTITVSPQVLYGRGPGSVAITHTIIAVLPHGIDQGGSIKFTLATAWGTTAYTTCSISGLSDIDSTHRASCSYTGNALTISGFADFSNNFLTKVIILVTNLLTPANIGSADVSRQIFAEDSSLTTYSSEGAVIDYFDLTDASVNGLTRVTIRPQLTVGKTNYQYLTVYPPNLNVGTANVYLKVTFPYNLPIGSTISVATPYPLVASITSLTDRCHLALLKYLSCTALANGFAITLGDNYNANTSIEIYIQQVLATPSVQPADPVGYKIVATWAGVTVIDDGNVLSNAQVFTPLKAAAGTISFAGTNKAIDFYPRNAYEGATYNFNLTSSVAFNTTHNLLILWPMEFDPYLGTAEERYTSEVGNYYISCSCPQMSKAYCRVDNWMVIINGVTNVAAGAQMDITIFGVRNPPTGTTGSFVVWQNDANLQLLALNSALGTITTTTLPGELDIRLVDASVRRLSTTADYSFQFYLADSVDATTELRLSFPPEASLAQLTSQASFPCTTKWLDQSGTEAALPQDWNSNTACQLNKDTNEVILSSAATTSKTFTASQQITVNVTGVPTPQWGQVRTPLSAVWDFDDSDFNVWTIYSWWTNQFKIFVYHSDATKKSISSRPYAMQNAAYLGFLQPLRSFSVNHFNPQSRANRIIVYPGTQSIDIPIRTANSSWPLEAKSVAFAASVNGNTPDNGGFHFSSFKHSWLMLQDEWEINFRVAAAATMNKGLYYITWALTETKQPQVTEGFYSPPPNTLVEVPAYKAHIYAFSVDTVNAISVGTTSLPVRVRVNNAPHADVAVTLEVLSPYNDTVSVSPTTLEYVPDLNSLYFTITVTADHDFEHLPQARISLKLSGTNADQYSISPVITAPITKVYYPIKGTIADISVKSITRTSFTMAHITDQTGVVYYAVSPRGAHIHSFAELKALMPNFLYTTDQLATEATTNDDARNGALDQVDPPEGTTWNAFNHRLFSKHMTSYLQYGAIVMRTSKASPVPVSGLWAGSIYQIVSYFDNLLLDEVPDQHLKFVWTEPTADFQPLLLNFSQSVPAAQGDTIKNILAKHLGVNPGRLQNQVVTTIYATTRRMQDTNDTTPPPPPPVVNVLGTSFQYDLVANRSLHVPTPTYAATLSNERRNDLTKELFSSLAATLLDFTLNFIPDRTPPTWVRPAQVQSFTNTSLTMQFQTSISGQVCCSALPESSPLVIPDQVIEGYSFNWTQVPNQCTPTVVNTLGTLTFPNLNPDTVYYVHCVATDSAPLWPSVMSYTTAYSVPFVTYHSPISNDMEILPAAGTSLSMAILLWLGLLH